MSPSPGLERAARGGLYRRLFAWIMSRLSARLEAELGDRKRQLLGELRGRVVEIGPGTGANLAYLGPEVRYIGIEPNLHMHAYLQRAASRLGLDIEVRTGAAEALPVADGEADAVLSSLVLCSVDRVEDALSEVRRILRPGGCFYFVEHVGAAAGTSLRRWQRRLTPAWRRLGDGCRPDRDLEAAIRSAGFARVEVEAFESKVVPALVRPHILGRACKAEA